MKGIMQILSLFVLGAVSCAWAGVDINRAGVEELAAELKGIGPKKAQAIVDYRKAHGGFKNINELAEVKGINEKTIEKNRANIEISRN